MADRNTLNRRRFIAGTSAAVVSAGSVGRAELLLAVQDLHARQRRTIFLERYGPGRQ